MLRVYLVFGIWYLTEYFLLLDLIHLVPCARRTPVVTQAAGANPARTAREWALAGGHHAAVKAIVRARAARLRAPASMARCVQDEFSAVRAAAAWRPTVSTREYTHIRCCSRDSALSRLAFLFVKRYLN